LLIQNKSASVCVRRTFNQGFSTQETHAHAHSRNTQHTHTHVHAHTQARTCTHTHTHTERARVGICRDLTILYDHKSTFGNVQHLTSGPQPRHTHTHTHTHTRVVQTEKVKLFKSLL